MPAIPPSQLNTGHLLQVLLPDDREAEPVDARAYYDQVITRLDGQLNIANLWRDRIRVFPIPPAPQSLPDLVQAARRRLRDDRLREDVQELDARRWVVQRVIEVINS